MIRKYNLNDLLESSIYDFKDKAELVNSIKLIQENFNQKREDLDDYLNDSKLVSAYSCFYMPTNMAKFSFLLNQLPQTLLKDLSGHTFYDVGTGPGTFILALLEYLKSKQKKYPKIVGIELSETMVEQAHKNIEIFFPEYKDWEIGNKIPQYGDKKILCFGHSVNEMGAERCLKYIDQIKPETIIFIGPGTPYVFDSLVEIKRSLKRQKFNVVYPCIKSISASCPFECSKQDWCHQVVYTTHDDSVERLAQLSSIDRRRMPVCIQVYKKKFHENLKVKRARILRVLKETKFSFEFLVCVESEQANLESRRFQVMKKQFDKAEKKNVSAFSEGMGFFYEVEKELGNLQQRVKIIEHNE